MVGNDGGNWREKGKEPACVHNHRAPSLVFGDMNEEYYFVLSLNKTCNGLLVAVMRRRSEWRSGMNISQQRPPLLLPDS
jgi:hypothetical protein